jgi:hypothetical protein
MEKTKHNLQEIQRIAEDRGGRFLSISYISTHMSGSQQGRQMFV